MPQTLERLWTDTELDNIESTITNLRRIRSASTCGLEPPKTGLLAVLSNLRQPPIPIDRQKVLKDGERLADAAASFLATRIIRNEKDQSYMEIWTQLLQETTNQYYRYPIATFARTTKAEVAVSTIDHLRAISIDPQYVLNWGLFKGNKLGARNLEELLKSNITIIAPFSGDLLLAAIYKTQLDLIKGRSFPLRAAGLSKDLHDSTLPDFSKIEESNPQEVGIFLDIVQSGHTGKALANALRTSYPSLIVHEPQMKRVEFRPNEKIRRVLGS
ncbi:hypothetical protein HY025_01775 [Candidatus Daviesbacteria bacterium]|nr:hypothetical protein [Candidatus Daviesbacteria bacterium]